MDSLKLCAIVTHVADARTCVLHPASHTHRQMNEELIRMIKLRIQGLPVEVEKFSEQLKKDGYHFLMESDDYPNRNSVYVRKYVEIRFKVQSNLVS